MYWQNLDRRWTTAILLALLPATALPAQDLDPAAPVSVLPAFTYASGTRAAAVPEGARAIVADLGLLARDPEQLRVDLPDGRSYVAFRTVSWTEEGDRRYWHGELHRDGRFEAAFDGTLALTITGERVSGTVFVEDTSFDISTDQQGRFFLGEMAPPDGKSSQVSCAAGPAASAGSQLAELTPAPLASATDDKKPGGQNPPLAVIDVLVIFPQSLAGAQLAATRQIIDDGFADSTLVFNNNGVPARFRPVYMGPLYGEQPPRPRTGDPRSAIVLGLAWMQGFIDGRGEALNRPPGMEVPPEEVGRLRDHLGADLVLLYVAPDADPSCGVAETTLPLLAVQRDQFAVIDTGCARRELLVAHELGHLLGMRHPTDEYETTPPAGFPFAYGYDDQDNLRIGGQPAGTVMACNPGTFIVPSGSTCNRIPHYSSPTQMVGGMTIGSATANNAEVARLRAPVAAARRTATGTPGNLPPSLTLVSPQGWRGQLRQWITLAAGAFDHEDGDRSAQIVWTSNLRGNLGVGAKILAQPTVTPGPETFTATVTDSLGLSFSRSVTLVFEAMVTTEGAIWHNPRDPGKFLSFNKNINDDWVATWMTVKNGKPVWYQSHVVHVSSTDGSFNTHLIAYALDFEGVQFGTYFGSISVAVETEKQLRLKVSPGSGGNYELLLEPFTRPVGPGSYWSLAPATGQVDPSWMIWRGPTAFGPGGQEARLVITFDGNEPTWVIGVGSNPATSGLPFFSMGMREPTAANPITNNYHLLNLRPAGSLDFASDGTGSIDLRFASGWGWLRGSQPMQASTVR